MLILNSTVKWALYNQELQVKLKTDILNTPVFLATINLMVKYPLATLTTDNMNYTYFYFVINGERIPQPLITKELSGFEMKKGENYVSINKLLSAKPEISVCFKNNEDYSIPFTSELYLLKLRMRG